VAHRVIWAASAQTNLESITRYIAEDSPRRAEIVASKLLDSTERLADFPYSGRMFAEWQDPDVREIIVYNYRVMYRVSPGLVTVFRVVHARMS
jgi:plasmid stabilization system protein ParE